MWGCVCCSRDDGWGGRRQLGRGTDRLLQAGISEKAEKLESSSGGEDEERTPEVVSSSTLHQFIINCS